MAQSPKYRMTKKSEISIYPKCSLGFWGFFSTFSGKHWCFEILWFDVRNYNDQLPDEILVPIKFSTCGKSSQFPTKKEEGEEKKDLFWSCRVNFNHFFRKIWHSVGTFTFSHVTKTKNTQLAAQLMIWIFLFLSKHA